MKMHVGMVTHHDWLQIDIEEKGTTLLGLVALQQENSSNNLYHVDLLHTEIFTLMSFKCAPIEQQMHTSVDISTTNNDRTMLQLLEMLCL